MGEEESKDIRKIEKQVMKLEGDIQTSIATVNGQIKALTANILATTQAMDKNIKSLHESVAELTRSMATTHGDYIEAVTIIRALNDRLEKIEAIQPKHADRISALERASSVLNGKFIGVGIAMTLLLSAGSLIVSLLHATGHV